MTPQHCDIEEQCQHFCVFKQMICPVYIRCCTSHSSAQSGQSIRQDERDKVLDKLITFRMTTNVKIEDETLGNYYTSLDAWKDFELLLEELRSKQKQP
jgi:hypothetical protein